MANAATGHLRDIMLYQCKACGYQEGRGCLTSVTRGLYLFGLMGVVTGVATFAIRRLRGGRPREPLDFEWWHLLLIPPAAILALLLTFAGALALGYLFELIEYTAFALKKCLNCGARKWSWGYTRGFGL